MHVICCDRLCSESARSFCDLQNCVPSEDLANSSNASKISNKIRAQSTRWCSKKTAHLLKHAECLREADGQLSFYLARTKTGMPNIVENNLNVLPLKSLTHSDSPRYDICWDPKGELAKGDCRLFPGEHRRFGHEASAHIRSVQGH